MERTRNQHDHAWALATLAIDKVKERLGAMPEEKERELFKDIYDGCCWMLNHYEISINRQQQRLRGMGRN